MHERSPAASAQESDAEPRSPEGGMGAAGLDGEPDTEPPSTGDRPAAHSQPGAYRY